MIYEEPQFRPGGDRCIEAYFGDEMSFDLNFLVHSVVRLVREADIDGIIELIPEMASMQISYDPDCISYGDASREVMSLFRSIGSLESLELDSRMFYVPLFYFDPWTRDCVDDYRKTIAEKEWDGDYLVRLNNLESLDQLKRVHSASDYWVAALGFWPGLCSLMPLDPRSRLIAPKYDPPRTWTPKGTIGHGGAITAIYPDRTPGGYQIFARTPMPIWDREQRLRAFQDSLALFKPGDRVRFQPIDREEYDYIDAKVRDGSYVHNYVEYERFSIRNYHAWLATLDETERPF
ncbi:MAG: allophanate hydrolase subunit 1 [Paracoccaceae bacterium]|nr:allophanate hydrolase subunit 1 [Paracoccaceae bacterium]MDE2913853.1 allophanate hydrolase subunit 1 [Paracoccaceae bacterium]